MFADVFGQTQGQGAEACLIVCQRPIDYLPKGLVVQEIEGDHPAAGEQRRNHLKRGVLGRGADQDDQTGFHVMEEGILLGLVEPVNLVDEQDGAFALKLALFFGFLDDFADLFDACQHCREMDEMGLCLTGNDPRQGGFSTSRRPPQDHGKNVIVFDCVAYEAARAGNVNLPEDIRKSRRANALGQRALMIGSGLGVLIE